MIKKTRFNFEFLISYSCGKKSIFNPFSDFKHKQYFCSIDKINNSNFEYDFKTELAQQKFNDKNDLVNKEKLLHKKIYNFDLEKTYINLNFRNLKDLEPEIFLNFLRNKEIYKKENLGKIILLLTTMRKFKKLENYNIEEVKYAFNYISDNLDDLNSIEFSSLSVNLSKMKIFDLEINKKIEIFLKNNAMKFNLQCLANVIFSFIGISKKQNILTDFYGLFNYLETIFAIKLKNNCDPVAICQIMIAYSKTQNFSKDFLIFFEKIVIDNFEKFKPNEITNIHYCFMKNNYKIDTFTELASNN